MVALSKLYLSSIFSFTIKPYSRAVSGINCHIQAAPALEITSFLKALSAIGKYLKSRGILYSFNVSSIYHI